MKALVVVGDEALTVREHCGWILDGLRAHIELHDIQRIICVNDASAVCHAAVFLVHQMGLGAVVFPRYEDSYGRPSRVMKPFRSGWMVLETYGLQSWIQPIGWTPESAMMRFAELLSSPSSCMAFVTPKGPDPVTQAVIQRAQDLGWDVSLLRTHAETATGAP